MGISTDDRSSAGQAWSSEWAKRLRELRWGLPIRAAETPRYALAALTVAGTAALMLTVRERLDVLDVALVFLLATFAVALLAGPGPAILTAVLSFLLFNLFFIEPYLTLTVDGVDHLLALFVYLGVAIVTGQLVARVRARTEAAVREQRRTALLYELNAALIGNATLDAVLARIVERVVNVYGADQCRILLPDEQGELTVRARFPARADATIDRQRLALAAWAMEHRTPAGRGSGRPKVRSPHGLGVPAQPPLRRGPDVLYVPIATAERAVGVLEVTGTPGGGRFDDEAEQVLASFANQAALALERSRLSDEAAKVAVLAQSDELKSALLSAVSHDLRTPLAAIKASVTSLLDRTVGWDEAATADFLEAIDEETDRLTLMVGNLLDLSRIEGGALRPAKEWYDVAELVEDVAGRLGKLAVDHRLKTEVEPDLPLAFLDYVEIAQVLINLGENAIRHTPAGTRICLSARRADGAIEFAVRDGGPGIAARHLPRIFETFYRVGADAGRRAAGTGIGLAICKGLVEAHGGRIWVESRAGEGTTFRFTVPIDAGDEGEQGGDGG